MIIILKPLLKISKLKKIKPFYKKVERGLKSKTGGIFQTITW